MTIQNRFIVALVVVILAGVSLYPIIHRVRSARVRRSWGWLITLVLLVLGAWASQPLAPWPRLGVVWALVFVAFKALVLTHTEPTALVGLTWWRYCGFVAGWLGMDVAAWIVPTAPVAAGWRRVLSGSAWLLGAGGLTWLLLRWPVAAAWALPRAWCAWVAGVIAVFFGFTRLLTGIWNVLGRNVAPLFDAPVYARSLTEWWGKRWNLAVHTTLHLVIWQPLRGRFGTAGAATAVFLVSGLLHEYLLSYPANGGWGGPIAYFVIQAAGMYAEHKRAVRRILRVAAWRKAAWTLVITLVPGPLLFHPALLEALVMPLGR